MGDYGPVQGKLVGVLRTCSVWMCLVLLTPCNVTPRTC